MNQNLNLKCVIIAKETSAKVQSVSFVVTVCKSCYSGKELESDKAKAFGLKGSKKHGLSCL